MNFEHSPHLPFLQCFHVRKRCNLGTDVLRDAELQVLKGEFVWITGPGGSGKTTLFKLLFGLELPDAGQIIIGGSNLSKMLSREVYAFRRRVGVIFQDLKLLPGKTSLDNVALPLIIGGMERFDVQRKAEQTLRAMGLGTKGSARCSDLSRQEQQLVAVARATISNPVLLLADEPTAYLDDSQSVLVLNLLKELSARGTTAIVFTRESPSPRLVSHGRKLMIHEGRILETRLAESVVPLSRARKA